MKIAEKKSGQSGSPGGYILVVEDSPVQAEIIAMLLEEHGYPVKKAANGRIALATARKELPALVASDILMPEMDGFEMTRQIRKDPALAPIPVLLLTGLTDADDVLQALSCGADSLVTKPYNDAFLLKKISQLVEKKRSGEQVQKPSVSFPFTYDGKVYTIAESREKIIEFLLTTYELTMERNRALISAQNELRDLNTRLEEREVERARLAAIEEYSEDAIIGKTLDGIITRWNAGAERIYGYSAQEMVGKNIALLVPPDQTDDTIIILERIKTGEPVVRYETLRRKKNGELINITLTASPIRDAQNHLIGVSTIAHDITWRKLTEETLRASEIRYRRLFETAQDGILILDAETGQIAEVNPFLIDMLGFSHEQFLGKKIWEIGFFRDIVANKDNFEELQRKEYIRYEDLPLETADGRRIAVEFVSNVYMVNNTKVIQCNIRDNTERKLAEEALRESETQLRATLESTADGILAVDNKGKIVQSNQRFIELWGIPPALMERGDARALQNFVLDQLTSPDTFLKKVQFLHDSEAVDMDRLVFKDGRVFEHYSSPMIMSGKPIGRVWSFRDITERNKMAEIIETSLAEKETLLKEIHHRVKNNLQIITSILNLQIRQENDPTIIEALKDSQSRVRSMALVHEHLYRGKDFSHIDLGNYMRALGTVLFQSYEAAKQGIRFDLEIRDIYVDINTSIPLGLISNELITNSLKYAFKEKKEGKISIIATENPQALTFVVADDGVGMPEGITLGNQTSLGLRLVSLLTGQLKGTVTIDRSEGTRFVFTIPKVPVQTPADRSLHTASSLGCVKEAGGGITDPMTAEPDKSGVNRE